MFVFAAPRFSACLWRILDKFYRGYATQPNPAFLGASIMFSFHDNWSVSIFQALSPFGYAGPSDIILTINKNSSRGD